MAKQQIWTTFNQVGAWIAFTSFVCHILNTLTNGRHPIYINKYMDSSRRDHFFKKLGLCRRKPMIETVIADVYGMVIAG